VEGVQLVGSRERDVPGARAQSEALPANGIEPNSGHGPDRNPAMQQISRQSDAKQDSEQLRFAPRTSLPRGGKVQPRRLRP